jgi:hypothetical protein
MSFRRVALALAAVAILASTAAPATAGRQETYVFRYDGANYVGWTARNGGAFVAFSGPTPGAAVPAWAGTVDIRVRDDRRRPVHGVATAVRNGFTHHRAVVCSGNVTTMLVRDTTDVQVRFGEGVSTAVLPLGCLRPVSRPTHGTVTLTFRS